MVFELLAKRRYDAVCRLLILSFAYGRAGRSKGLGALTSNNKFRVVSLIVCLELYHPPVSPLRRLAVRPAVKHRRRARMQRTYVQRRV